MQLLGRVVLPALARQDHAVFLLFKSVGAQIL
jgi:hypothetical protein